MASLDDKSLFEDIFRLENDTPAEAIGPEGDISYANIQAQQLANRTRWLRTQLVSISDFREYTFFKTAEDPDGTIAGRANTPNNKLFRVSQGDDDELAFKYYLHKDGVAIPDTTLIGIGSIKNTIRQFPTLAAAQADADAGNIPVGSNAYYRDSDYKYLAIEVINNSGILSATGRVMISKGYIDYLASRGLIPAELDSELEYSEVKYDPVSGRMSEFSLSDGRVFIPLLQLADRSVGSMQLEDNAVTSDKLSSDLNNVIPRNLDPDTGYSDVSYDPVTNKMSTYTMTDGRVFIPLLQINTGAVGMTQLATELQKLIPMELDPDSGYSRVNYDPVTMRMSDYITTDGGVFISRLILGDEVVGFKTLNTALQNKIIAHPQDVVDARPDATRSTLSEIAVRTNA
ncbi:hypothetical protein DMR27_04935, partial [Klebsiella variicola]